MHGGLNKMLNYTRNLLTAMLLLLAVPAFAVKVGEPVPDLKNVQWVKGGPVDISQGRGGNVYLIEFCATWFPPCLESIPHLTALQEKYKKDGLIVVGISIDKDIETVVNFVSKNNAMNYNVGFDKDGIAAEKYMPQESAGTIPVSFLVDKTGIVVWSGHPLEMEKIVDDVVRGAFDAKKSAMRQNINKQLMQEIINRNYEGALKLTDELLELEPGNERFINLKASLLKLTGKDDSALIFIEKQIKLYPEKAALKSIKISMLYQLKRYQALENECDSASISSCDPMVLNGIALEMINHKAGQQNVMLLQTALKLADTAYSKGKFIENEQKAKVASTLAHCYFKLNKFDRAVEMQKTSIALTKNKKKIIELINTLKEYQSAATGGINKQ